MNDLSPSARVLAAIVARSSASTISRQLGCTEGTVRGWMRGRRIPEPAWRSKLYSFDDRLVVDGWDDSSELPPPDDGGEREPPLTAPRMPPSAAGEARLVEVIAQCDELFAAAVSDPKMHASVRDLTAILAAKSNAVIRLSKVRGEDAVSMQKILDSKWWKEIERIFEDVVRPLGGDVASELGRRLRARAGSAG